MSRLLPRSTAVALVFAISFLILMVAASSDLVAQDPGSATTTTEAQTGSGSVSAVESGGGSAATSGSLFTIISYLIPLLGVAGLVFTFWKSSWVAQQEVGTEKMARIAQH